MTVKKKKTRNKFDDDVEFDRDRTITKNRRPIRDWTKAVSSFDEEDIEYFEDVVDSRK